VEELDSVDLTVEKSPRSGSTTPLVRARHPPGFRLRVFVLSSRGWYSSSSSPSVSDSVRSSMATTQCEKWCMRAVVPIELETNFVCCPVPAYHDTFCIFPRYLASQITWWRSGERGQATQILNKSKRGRTPKGSPVLSLWYSRSTPQACALGNSFRPPPTILIACIRLPSPQGSFKTLFIHPAAARP
jgi:hypothetical protein